MNKLKLESSETLLNELFYRKQHGEIIDINELENFYKFTIPNYTPQFLSYSTEDITNIIKSRRKYHTLEGLLFAYMFISFFVWLVTLIYMKITDMPTQVSVGYNSIEGWKLSHSVYISIIMLNAVFTVGLFLLYNILDVFKKFYRISRKTYYKYQEDKEIKK